MLNYNLRKKFIVLFAGLLVVVAISNYYLFLGYSNQKYTYISNQNNQLESQINALLLSREQFSNYVFKSLIDNDYIKELMSEAYSSDEATRDRLRKELYGYLQKDYVFSTEYDFRQLHFHFPDTTSFLRMHEPEKYGDNLGEVRESIRIVNEEKRYVKGFEEGKIYNGYRFIYPLSYNGQHVGSVEVSISFDALASVLSELYDRDYFFAVKKDVVTNTLFKEELENYTESFFSEDYLFDLGLLESESKVLALKTVEMIMDESGDISYELEQGEKFGVLSEYGGQDYILNFLPIENISGKVVAYFISLSGDTDLFHIKTEYIQRTVHINVIILLLFFVFVMHIRNISQLETISYVDNLTKIYNRHKFLELAESELSRSIRYGSDLSFILFDLDHFKKVNDTYGHNEGDLVLRKVAKIVSANLRKTDIFARWGGEEFIVLLPETSLENAYTTAEKIRQAVECQQFGKVKKLTISLGVSTVYNCKNLLASIDLADKALYESKQNGRNRTTVASPGKCLECSECSKDEGSES
ncbi:putative diguanylate cyclase YdaM [Andreesenia angusta]|uniref:Putative diguanylate cyclase YdaM n=1 Tax=Andreesenia angusta TaxID=39480 RepID=A0A1S1VBS6_9FIRM|nr:diguanylate cyclase [Andreesenia angusta]OHW63269.1 putative diguanylate cyclase YdaM [Andreesenia angusta]